MKTAKEYLISKGISEDEIITKDSGNFVKVFKVHELLNEYALEYHKENSPNITAHHCTCSGDHLGMVLDPKCLVHGCNH